MQKNLSQESTAESTLAAVQHFNEAFNKRDLNAVMVAMTDDCVFENTYPPPDGERYEGQATVRTFFEQFFASSKNPLFELEDIFACGDRCAARWIYHWSEPDGRAGHVRGVDIFRVRDGKVAEKLSYVKG